MIHVSMPNPRQRVVLPTTSSSSAPPYPDTLTTNPLPFLSPVEEEQRTYGAH